MINRETGEVITFGDRHDDVAPEKAVNDIMRRLGINPKPEDMRTSGADDFNIELSNDDFMKVEEETVGKRYQRKAKKARERLDVDNLMTRLEDWALDAGEQFSADNPDTEMQDVALDLAKSAEYAFEPDEWETLLIDGPFDRPEDLYTYVAELIA